MTRHVHPSPPRPYPHSRLPLVVLVLVGLVLGPLVSVTSVPVAGAAGPPITLSPSPLDFGTHPVGTQGKVRSVTLTNQSGGALWLEEWRVEGALWEGGIFAATVVDDQPNCPVFNMGYSIPAGAQCTLSVAFYPAAVSDYRATLKVRVKPVGGDVFSATTHEVPIIASGAAAQLSFTPATYSFGDVAMGTTAFKAVTVTNVTNGALTITGVTSPDPHFWAERGTCGQPAVDFTLPAGGTCTAHVWFSPPVGGSRERVDHVGHVYVSVADPKSSSGVGPTYIWRPTGVGVGTRSLALEGPTTIDFGRVRIGTRKPARDEWGQSFTIRNTGSLNVDVSDLRIMDGWTASSGGYGLPLNVTSGDAAAVPGRCSQHLTLYPGEGCWVEPYFDPAYPEPDVVGQTDRTIEIVSDAPGGPLRVSLRAFAFYDREAPTTVPHVLEPALGANGWYRSDVNVHLVATDAPADGSGVASITYGSDAASAQQIPRATVARDSVTLPAITAEGTTTILFGATDRDGNAEVADKGLLRSFTVRLDRTSPTTAATTDAAPLAGGWYAGAVTVRLAATDALSGVRSLTYRASGAQLVASTTVAGPQASLTVSSAGETTITFAATDTAGNVEAEQMLTVRIDGTAPVTRAMVTPITQGTGWHTSDATIALTATDVGSGVDSITYRASGAHEIAATTVDGDHATLTISHEGVTTVTYAATDRAGNVETARMIVIRLDKTAPTVRCEQPDGAWHRDDVDLLCTASDALSGIDPADAQFSLSTDVAAGEETADAPTGSREVSDAAGNVATAGPIRGNKIDQKAPQITITAPVAGAQYVVNETVRAAYACVDGGSGVVACDGSVASGAVIATATPGSAVFSVTARDHVGNPAVASAPYTVTYRICVLYDETAAHRAGSVVPIKLRLCDSGGANLSSAAIALTATGLTKLDGSGTSAPAEDAGAANPERRFRYDQQLAGYIYDLSTNGLTRGTWAMAFTVAGDAVAHQVTFTVR